MTTGDRSVEARIEQLVELEQELTGTGSTSKKPTSRAEGDPYTEGRIHGASRVPAEEVPAEYPVDIETEVAFRIDVDVGPEVVETYIEWNVDADGQSHIGQLLDALDRRPENFADIFGDRVALDRQNGYYGIHAARTRAHVGAVSARADSRLRWLGRGLAFLTGAVLVGTAALDLETYLLAVPLIFLFPFIPIVLFFDQRRLKNHIEWDRDRMWLLGSLVPVVQLPFAAGYLIERKSRLRVDVFGPHPPTIWHRAVIASTVALVIVMVNMVQMDAHGMLFFLSVGFLTIAVFFDSLYLHDIVGWPASATNQSIYVFFAGLILFGPVYAAWYLYTRRQVTAD